MRIRVRKRIDHRTPLCLGRITHRCIFILRNKTWHRYSLYIENKRLFPLGGNGTCTLTVGVVGDIPGGYDYELTTNSDYRHVVAMTSGKCITPILPWPYAKRSFGLSLELVPVCRKLARKSRRRQPLLSSVHGYLLESRLHTSGIMLTL